MFWGLGIFAPSCGGNSPLWMSFEPSVSPPEIVHWIYQWSLSGAMADDDYESFFIPFQPPDPPPRPHHISI